MCRCDRPAVRIGDNGRVFCATCRMYLDARPQTTPEPLRDEEGQKTSIAQPDVDGTPSTDLTGPLD